MLGWSSAGALGVGVVYAAREYGGPTAIAGASVAGVLFAAAGIAGAIYLLQRRPLHALAAAGVLGVLAHGVATGVAAPWLHTLWVSKHAAEVLEKAGSWTRATASPPGRWPWPATTSPAWSSRSAPRPS